MGRHPAQVPVSRWHDFLCGTTATRPSTLLPADAPDAQPWQSMYRLAPSSMRGLSLSVPTMSSRYSSRPVSCGPCAIGFIMLICSTSPCAAPSRRRCELQQLGDHAAALNAGPAVLD